MIRIDRTPNLSHPPMNTHALILRDMSEGARATFRTPVKTPSGDFRLVKTTRLNPALMAVRCVFSPILGGQLTDGKVYHAVFDAPKSHDRDQYLKVRDDNGHWCTLSATRFEPCNAKRRALFDHLQTQGKRK